MENALITGATKGIGRAIAEAFAKQGINMAICSRNSEELHKTQLYLQELNPQIKIHASVTDCADKVQLLQFAAQAELELGFINLLVNNVGTYEPCSVLDDEEDTLQQQLNINLMPSYELYRYFGRTMMAARVGHIFNICSIAAIEPVVNAGSYSVTKAAQLSLNHVMRLETQAYGVKVTAVLPGSTFTASWEGADIDQQRFVQPQDVAAAIVSCYRMSPGANAEQIIIKPVFGQL